MAAHSHLRSLPKTMTHHTDILAGKTPMHIKKGKKDTKRRNHQKESEKGRERGERKQKEEERRKEAVKL